MCASMISRQEAIPLERIMRAIFVFRMETVCYGSRERAEKLQDERRPFLDCVFAEPYH